MLTQTQIKNIANLDTNTCIEVLRECADNLGLISVEEYHELTKTPKRTIYLHIKQNKLKSITLCKKLFIILN